MIAPPQTGSWQALPILVSIAAVDVASPWLPQDKPYCYRWMGNPFYYKSLWIAFIFEDTFADEAQAGFFFGQTRNTASKCGYRAASSNSQSLLVLSINKQFIVGSYRLFITIIVDYY